MHRARHYRFSGGAYERLGMGGILGDAARMELIGGEIPLIGLIGDAHAGCVNRLNRRLVLALGERASYRACRKARKGTAS